MTCVISMFVFLTEILEDIIRIVQLSCALLIWKKEIEVINSQTHLLRIIF